MQCCGAIYHLVDPKIDKNRQNTQDTCSQNPGACFFWGRRSAAGSTDTTHPGGRPETGNKCTCWVDISDIFQKCRLFKMPKLKSWNVPGNVFRISKNPDMRKSWKSEKSRFGGLFSEIRSPVPGAIVTKWIPCPATGPKWVPDFVEPLGANGSRAHTGPHTGPIVTSVIMEA